MPDDEYYDKTDTWTLVNDHSTKLSSQKLGFDEALPQSTCLNLTPVFSATSSMISLIQHEIYERTNFLREWYTMASLTGSL